MLTREVLTRHHQTMRSAIRAKLAEFRRPKTNDMQFEELCFCILAAGTSARLAQQTIATFDYDTLHSGNFKKIQKVLKSCYRFHTIRANYLADAKINFKKIDLMKDSRRADLIREIKGIGPKEASHFLRNIGYSGYAILDKHVIGLMHDLGVFETRKAPSSLKQYEILEAQLKDFAQTQNIDFDELDLALWSYKTGEIIK